MGWLRRREVRVIAHKAPADALAIALLLIPPEFEVTPNVMGNLAMLNPDGDYVGYIDLAEGPDNCTVHWTG